MTKCCVESGSVCGHSNQSLSMSPSICGAVIVGLTASGVDFHSAGLSWCCGTNSQYITVVIYFDSVSKPFACVCFCGLDCCLLCPSIVSGSVYAHSPGVHMHNTCVILIAWCGYKKIFRCGASTCGVCGFC